MSNLLKKIFPKTTLTKTVALPGVLIIVTISLLCGIFPNRAEYILDIVKDNIFQNLSWVYVLIVTVFVLFLILIGISKYGNIRLGPEDSKPKYSFYSWIAMLFAAGMGIGLMYFGVAETMAHYTEPAISNLDVTQRAKEAQLYTFFHWGIHAWAIYAVVGLTLAFFAYRYNLPLAIRSGLYPILKDRIYGPIGHIIDTFGLCSTFFGIATTLGFGVVQINAGLQSIGILEDSSFTIQAIIVLVMMSLSMLSALSGLDKGVKNLSSLNIIVAVALMVFILLVGPTIYILGTFTEGIGHYISNFVELTFHTYAYETDSQEWFSKWTILYWAWWISWSPYVGLFIARISKGRTIREFIIAVLLIPSLFNFLWMTVFGSSAVWFDKHTADGALSAVADNPDLLLFQFFEYMPLSSILSIIAMIVIGIFFVTAADSGIYIMNRIATKDDKSPKWQNIFWGSLLILMALALLRTGGLGALQTMTLISALPFGIIMLLLCFCLWKALGIDSKFHEADSSHNAGNWNATNWKDKLDQVLSLSDKEDMSDFFKTLSKAFRELQKELEYRDIEAHIYKNKTKEHSREIVIKHDKILDFVYGVASEEQELSEMMLNEDNTVKTETDLQTFLPITYFGDGRLGYDIQYMSKDEIIADILREYDRYLTLLADDSNELIIAANKDQKKEIEGQGQE